VIRAQVQRQGSLGIERMCDLARVSRAGYYRAWEGSAPRQEATELRDRIQLLRVEHRYYGHRRIAVLLQRSGWPVNKKRVLRLMREDNLLCVTRRSFVPATTDSRHRWQIYPNLARTLVPTAINQLWVADITLGSSPRAGSTSAYRRRLFTWRCCWMRSAAG